MVGSSETAALCRPIAAGAAEVVDEAETREPRVLLGLAAAAVSVLSSPTGFARLDVMERDSASGALRHEPAAAQSVVCATARAAATCEKAGRSLLMSPGCWAKERATAAAR